MDNELGNCAADCIEIAIEALAKIMALEDSNNLSYEARKAILIAGNARMAIANRMYSTRNLLNNDKTGT